MIVKNEEKTLLRTFESCKDVCKMYIIHDTGSTDSTISLIETWCKHNQKEYILERHSFVDFGKNRTLLLKSAFQTDCTHLLLLDSNEELRDGMMLPLILEKHLFDAYMLPLRLSLDGTTTTFWNIKLVRNLEGWEYRMPVHEYIYRESMTMCQLEQGPSIYQDRNNDIQKSKNRYQRDLDILKQGDQTDPRVVFYLAQTYHSLGDTERAIETFQRRVEMDKSYPLEVYESLYRLGILTNDVMYFKQAHELCPTRAEPLFQLGRFYAFQEKNYKLSYMYLKKACEMDYPYGESLFIDDDIYTKHRYALCQLVEKKLSLK